MSKENLEKFKLKCKNYLTTIDLHRLRAYGRFVGVERPAAKDKETLIDDIVAILGETFGSGVTMIEARGGYSGKEKAMIYFVVNRYQIIKMKELVHDIDPNAYITISEVADVFSNNHNK